MVGAVLRDRYEIVAKIGQGGMGAVYLANDRRLTGRRVAVKIIHLVGTTESDPTAAITAEAQVLARLDHPALPRVSDFFTIDEPSRPVALVMDYIAGQDLAAIVKEARRKGRLLPVSQVLDWAEALCDVLTYLHLQEPTILHRDIKPGNIKLAPDGTIKLVDFGIAHQVDQQDEQTLTGTHGMGTLPYLPLELYGADLSNNDPRADLYALGATLYHLLTGEQPLSAQERFLQPERFVPPSRLVPALPPHVERAILRAMALKPAERPASAQAFKHELLGASLPAGAPPTGALGDALLANIGLLVAAMVLLLAALLMTIS